MKRKCNTEYFTLLRKLFIKDNFTPRTVLLVEFRANFHEHTLRKDPTRTLPYFCLPLKAISSVGWFKCWGK